MNTACCSKNPGMARSQALGQSRVMQEQALKDDEKRGLRITRNNHAAKGSRIAVGPIKGKKDLATIAKLLADRPRDHALFVVGKYLCIQPDEIRSVYAYELV